VSREEAGEKCLNVLFVRGKETVKAFSRTGRKVFERENAVIVSVKHDGGVIRISTISSGRNERVLGDAAYERRPRDRPAAVISKEGVVRLRIKRGGRGPR